MTNRFAVQCLECNRKFKTASLVPVCPNCHSTDIELPADINVSFSSEPLIRSTLRIPQTLHCQVNRIAYVENLSMQQTILLALRRFVLEDKEQRAKKAKHAQS